MKAKTIDEVIEALDLIIEDAKKTNNPKGYFAALYRKVTKRVKKGIAAGEFEDGERMERLDVLFANRYLNAYDNYFEGQTTTKSWTVAFDHTKQYWPIVLQHLLWGMNAHINLDLGIAAAAVAPGDSIHSLKKDFDRINALLASLVGEVEQELSEIWPTLKYILTLSQKIDDFLVNFSMKAARDGAWRFALKLAAASEEERWKLIKDRDETIKEIANCVDPPGFIPRLVFALIRLGEKRDIAKVIEILE
ncbi:DUF5995 family protein [Aureispira sp. CCB-QB1]|uniref:DUF5995 family protein n=1 Tax=Aureispira sp. CCB-QB1 TaxID=1313421 RepID=UPI0006979677|nr:DUF5995 family protein [Aureispira sp. CCB-QB1]